MDVKVNNSFNDKGSAEYDYYNYDGNTTLEATFFKPEGFTYHFIYSSFSLVGVWANSLLYVAVKRKMGIFGNRKTFTFLMKVLSVLDIILSCLIPVDMTLLSALQLAYKYEYFVHIRNLVLIYESYILLIIAIDRYLAIKRPFSQSWNTRLIHRIIGILFAVTLLIDLLDLIPKIVMPLYGDFPNIMIYMITITVIFIFIVFLTLVIYALLYITHYRYIQAAKRSMQSTVGTSSQKTSLRITHTALGPPPIEEVSQNIEMTHMNGIGNGGLDAVSCEELNSAVPLCSTQKSHSIITTTSIVVGRHTESVFHRHRVSQKLLCTLSGVSMVYTVSILPHALAGWHVIPFPGYIVYHLFYLNAIANPFIYSITDPSLFRTLCQATRKLFLTRTSSSSTRPTQIGRVRELRLSHMKTNSL